MTFIKYLLKRLALIFYSSIVFSIILPLIAFLPLNITIILIPMSYALYFIPAAAVGASVGILLAFADRWFKPGKALIIWVGSILSPIYAFFYVTHAEHLSNFITAFQYIPPRTPEEPSIFSTIVLCVDFLLFSLVVAGGSACSALFRGRLVDELLEK